MKKFFAFIAVALFSATSLMAQAPEKGLSWAVETGIGSEWEIGGRAQYNFNKYIAAEGVAKYAVDYGNGGSVNEITIQVGARGFSPEFGPSLKAFAAFDLGYGAMFKDGYNTNACAIDLTIGMYVWKGLYAGYGFGALCKNGSHKDHLLRVGFNF